MHCAVLHRIFKSACQPLNRTAFAAALAAFLLLSGPAPALAQADAAAAKALTKQCLDCHDDPKVATKDGKSMQVVTADFRRSAHRKVECSDCHQAALTSKHPDEPLGAVKPQVCVECHQDQIKEVAGSIHGKRAAGQKAIKDCTGCHDSLHKVFKLSLIHISEPTRPY